MSGTQRIPEKASAVDNLQRDLRDFLLDVQTANRAPRTVLFYRFKLVPFLDFLRAQGVADAGDIEPSHIRAFLASLTDTHTAGGIHAYWRSLRAFLRFLVREDIIDSSPLEKLRPPRVDVEPLEPVNLEHLAAMLATCDRSDIGLRDRALLLTLLDTGLRAGECIALNVGDVDLDKGHVIVRKSKNRKPRVVFLGKQARRAVGRYLRGRAAVQADHPLWLAYLGSDNVKRLDYGGLREIVRRRAARVRVPAPTLHSFRRGFALTMLRNGADVVSISRMMGHGSLAVLMRYLRQGADDLERVHEEHSPVDRMNHDGDMLRPRASTSRRTSDTGQ